MKQLNSILFRPLLAVMVLVIIAGCAGQGGASQTPVTPLATTAEAASSAACRSNPDPERRGFALGGGYCCVDEYRGPCAHASCPDGGGRGNGCGVANDRGFDRITRRNDRSRCSRNRAGHNHHRPQRRQQA